MTTPRTSTGRRGRLPVHERERRRAEVVRATLAELAERGYAEVTMQSIASRAGASKETLYAWFGDRDGLITAAIETSADESAARIAAALAEPPVDSEEARATLTAYAAALLTLLTGPVSVGINRAAMTSPTLATQLLAAGRHRIGPLAEAYLADLHAAGLLRAPEPAAAYREFYGLVMQDTQIRVLLGEPAPSPAEVRTRAADAVAGFFALRGAGTPLRGHSP